MPRKTSILDMGLMDYKKAWDLQTEIHEDLKSKKIAARKAGQAYSFHHYIMFVEHNHVYTLGKSGKMDHLKYSPAQLEEKGISFHKINRGGDITYHGEGQLTVYPIFDLDDFFHDVHRYVRLIEEVIIRLLFDYQIEGFRRKEYTGVWVEHEGLKKKICAIGIHLSRWVSMHGLAFNVNTDLNYFDGIIPCGINEKGSDITSLQELLKQSIPMQEVKDQLIRKFQEVFDLEIQYNSANAKLD